MCDVQCAMCNVQCAMCSVQLRRLRRLIYPAAIAAGTGQVASACYIMGVRGRQPPSIRLLTEPFHGLFFFAVDE